MYKKILVVLLILFLGALYVYLDGTEITIDEGNNEHMEWYGKKVQYTWKSTYALVVMVVLFIVFLIVTALRRKIK